MNKIEKLTQLLRKLNSGENPAEVKRDAKDFIASLSPHDLSIAEQKLIEAGLSPEDLRSLCSVHIEVLKEQVEKMKAKLKPGHVIHTMMSEHDMILGFLEQLDHLNSVIQAMETYDGSKEEFKTLKHIAEYLVETEFHHQREENVVFPEMERKGVTAPQHIMRMEHKDLRLKKQILKELVDNIATIDFPKFKQELNDVTKYIVFNLREHILKENTILYPTAIEIINEKESWERMKEECDKIGYCCFTPKPQ